MSEPLQGLTGLYGDPQDVEDTFDEGALEARANVLDPDHAHYGSQAYGYSGTVPTDSPFTGFSIYDGGLAGDGYSGMTYPDMGVMDDHTPTAHCSPYPRGIQQPSWDNPNGYALAGEAMQAVHGVDLGGPDLYIFTAPGGRERPVNISVDRYDSPDDVMLAKEPGQLRGSRSGSNTGRGAGNADVDQGYGQANSLPEFAHGHSIRVVQHDSARFDYTATHGEQDVPFWGRHPVQQMPFSGPDSPYFSSGEIDGANIVWEGRMGDPAPYVQPPEPAFAAPLGGQPDVFAWG